MPLLFLPHSNIKKQQQRRLQYSMYLSVFYLGVTTRRVYLRVQYDQVLVGETKTVPRAQGVKAGS